MKVLVTGAGGLVGSAVARHCAAQAQEVIAFDHQRLDIAELDSVRPVMSHVRPDVVINCAAWTDVDGCETDPEHARKANARGPEVLASSCQEVGALLITISTDYVFDGRKVGFYTQEDQPNPISVYGQSKLEGEARAQRAHARTIVVRSGYIFGAGGKNFLSTFLVRARAGDTLKAISDMVGTPTYAPDLARQLYQLAQVNRPGTYHVVNAGDGVSFEGFARAALEIAGLDSSLLQSTTLAELNRPAPRPRNSRLRCLLSQEAGLDPMPSWQAALRLFVAEQSHRVSRMDAGAQPS
ncbi:MAG TPA: dTDP-4-dehydrorhamnose reductase [Pyrinomonadaceae bacterium]